jgi:hypothetical protein
MTRERSITAASLGLRSCVESRGFALYPSELLFLASNSRPASPDSEGGTVVATVATVRIVLNAFDDLSPGIGTLLASSEEATVVFVVCVVPLAIDILPGDSWSGSPDVAKARFPICGVLGVLGSGDVLASKNGTSSSSESEAMADSSIRCGCLVVDAGVLAFPCSSPGLSDLTVGKEGPVGLHLFFVVEVGIPSHCIVDKFGVETDAPLLRAVPYGLRG